MPEPAPGVRGAGAAVYKLLRDSREESPVMPLVGQSLWSGASFQDLVKRHMMMTVKFPHASMGKDIPYGGIENLRPGPWLEKIRHRLNRLLFI